MKIGSMQVGRVSLIIACLLGVFAGVASGVGAYTFLYARGASYLTDEPSACANCHIMRDYHEAWLKSSHQAVAVCNDCHTPADFIGKYAAKALNGYHHSMAFTTGRFHEPLQITPLNHRITENACRHCHEDIVQGIDWHPGDAGELSCVRCHFSVGHLR